MCQFFPEHRLPHLCSLPWTPFRGCWKSVATTIHYLILVKVDGKCQRQVPISSWQLIALDFTPSLFSEAIPSGQCVGRTKVSKRWNYISSEFNFKCKLNFPRYTILCKQWNTNTGTNFNNTAIRILYIEYRAECNS